MTYVVEVSFHVNQSQCFLQEEDKQARWNLVRVEFIVVHISFLSKCERAVIESYSQNLLCQFRSFKTML